MMFPTGYNGWFAIDELNVIKGDIAVAIGAVVLFRREAHLHVFQVTQKRFSLIPTFALFTCPVICKRNTTLEKNIRPPTPLNISP